MDTGFNFLQDITKIRQNDIDKTDYKLIESNILIEAYYNLDIVEHKVLNAVISQINMYDKELKTFQFTAKQLAQLCNLAPNNIKRTIFRLQDSLMRKTFKYPTSIINSRGEKIATMRVCHWIRYIDYNDSLIVIRLSDDLKPFLLDLKENFTQKRLQEIQEYESEYSIRLDMLFTMIINKNSKFKSLDTKINKPTRIRYDLSLLKEILGIENKYSQFKEFNRNVLKVAQEEINRRGFYNISIEKEIENKQCVAIVFFVYLGEKYKTKLKEQALENNNKKKEKEEIQNLKNIFIFIGFTQKEIKMIFSKNELNKINDAYQSMITQNIINNEDRKKYLLEKLN